MNKLVSLIIVMLFSITSFAQNDLAVKGKKLFKQNCASCHKVDQKLIGPALNEALDNWGGDKEAMYMWVKNWAKAVEAGYPRAVEVQNYDASAMTLFPQLKDEDIDAIFAYVDNPASAENPGVVSSASVDTAATSKQGFGANWLLIALLVMFVILALLLAQVSSNLEHLVAEKQGVELPEQKPLFARIFNKKVLSLLSLIAMGIVGFVTYNSAASLGRSQGYEAKQPIAFSHKLHAGTLEIDCQYCHTSAAVSKSASIPATNVCMNCHKSVQEGPTGNKKEIEKIYKAAGFDPETLSYSKESTGAVEWVRMHNLPDHVFFSHAQHVTAGKIECQTCHGEIQEMEVVAQHSNLSMGWCINCHRETKVQFTENAYYDDLFEEYHDKLKAGDKDFFVTVEKIGGLECQKCHY